MARTSVWRLGVQIGFAVVSLLIGYQFIRFVEAAQQTTTGPLPARPPGVEGYLPISGLMGALDWFYQGTLNTIHPAATILFLTFVSLSLIVRKSFCGWICPVGLLSESLARFGQWSFKRNLRLPRWLDIPLRSLKYLLLGFFIWAIFSMSPAELRAFITSPYNKISDVKMLYFFVDISLTAAIVISVLAVLSIIVHSFWCRYLCPYGALLGLFSWISPTRVHRSESICTGCGVCDKICPARLPVSRKPSISSVECIGCTDCVVSCPVPSSLHFGTRRRGFSPMRLAVAVAAIFLVVTTAARITGHWRTGLTEDEIRYHVTRMHSPAYGHPGMQR
jgi:polyferredoxin